MHEAVVIGGGPGGSTAAALLASAGRDVALFERDRFPRFHIGESLLPHNMRIFERLGIVGAMKERFVEKWGVEFISSDGRHSRLYHFDRAIDPRYPMCFQVLRSEFDHLILKEAAARGAAVHEGARVLAARQEPDRTWRITVREEGGASREVAARFLIDASGRDGFLATRLGLRRMDPVQRRAGVFAHFRGIPRRSGRDAGNIVMVLLKDAWLWLIPLAGGVTSVGLVTQGSRIKEQGLAPGKLLDRAVRCCPAARALLQGAERVCEPRSTSDWTYACSRRAGDGYLLVGDAGAFVDPVFSSGVFLAMSSAELAADLLDEALRRNDLSRHRFRSFERTVRRHVAAYERVVGVFYGPAFSKLCLFPETRMGIPEALIGVLAGDLEPRWAVRWRLEVFHSIAALFGRFDLGARLNLDRVFDSEAEEGALGRGAGSV